MTDAQRSRIYFPAWSELSNAMGWVWSRGRLRADLDAQQKLFNSFHGPAREAGMNVLIHALNIAGQNHRAVTPQDLRHAANLVATGGKHSSSKKFSNRELNHFRNLCALLRKPDNLQAVHRWEDPDAADREDCVAWIRELAPEDYILAITRDVWKTGDWEKLELKQLEWLLGRVREKSKPTPRRTTQPETADCPY